MMYGAQAWGNGPNGKVVESKTWTDASEESREDTKNAIGTPPLALSGDIVTTKRTRAMNDCTVIGET
jgi:hypothetical protein